MSCLMKFVLTASGSKTDTTADIMVLFVLVFVIMRVGFRMFVKLVKLIKATVYDSEITVKMKFSENALIL